MKEEPEGKKTAASKDQQHDKLQQVAWMLERKDLGKSDFIPDYGDLSLLNDDGLILRMVGREHLQDIVSDYLDLLETSASVYERNGDYALGMFTSGWCKLMDSSSRKLCNTSNNLKALQTGKWLCHESCWKDASLKCMQQDKPVDIHCAGGLRLYAVPVKAKGKIIGAINFGYGDPPSDEAKLKALAKKYGIPLKELQKQAKAYQSRPPFIIDLAKHHIQRSAKYIGNIIERKLAQKAAQENEQKLQITLDSIGDAVIATDLQARITIMNPEAERLCGYNLKKSKGKNLTDVFNIVHALTGEKAENPVNKALQTGKVVGLANHTMLISKDGNEYQIADSASPIKDKHGNTSGVVMVFRDVTEEYSMREKLKNSHYLMNYIIKHNRSAVAVHDRDLRYIYVSQKYIDDYKVKESDVIGKHHYEVFPDLPQKWREVHQKALAGEVHSAEDDPFYREDGSVDWTRWECRPWYESNGSIGGIVIYTEVINERKQKEMRLKDSEEKHRRLFETMSQGVIYQTADGSIISANPAAERMLGLSLDQMQGKTSMDPRWKMITEDGKKVPGSDHPAMISLRTGEKTGPVTRGVYIPEKDEYVWLSITATPLFKPGEDKPFQSYAVFDNVSRQKQYEDERREYQQLIHTILHKLPIGIAINTIEPEPKVELVNDNFAQIYGLKTGDLLTVDSFWEAVYEDEAFRKKIKDRVFTDMDSGDPAKMVWHDIPITKNGKVVKYITAQNIPLKDREVVISTVMDVTERKLTEKTQQVLFQIANEILQNYNLDDFIRAVEQQLSKLVDTTNFYIALYDSETGLLSAPFEKDEIDRIDTWPAERSATGIVIDRKQSVLLQKQDVLRLIESGEIQQTGTICEAWLGVPLFKGTKVSGVMVVQSYDNPEAFDRSTMELFEYVSNQISMALERTRIFKDLLHAKNKAEESDRLKSAFLANMSHEIRTPMNGIMGFAELLKDPGLTGEQQQQYIEIIEKSGERMLNIINDIMEISRIEAGVMDVMLEASNINEQLDFAYSFFKPEVEAKGMQLLLSDVLPAKQAKVVTDREKLFAVLTNLIKNAIKYSNEGFIEFGCATKGSFQEFFVKDTGIGIPKDRQHAVFSRFVQADIEDKEARQGAGLGLAISKAYVEMLGGDIWMESEEGKGSTFYFTIPGKSHGEKCVLPHEKR